MLDAECWMLDARCLMLMLNAECYSQLSSQNDNEEKKRKRNPTVISLQYIYQVG